MTSYNLRGRSRRFMWDPGCACVPALPLGCFVRFDQIGVLDETALVPL